MNHISFINHCIGLAEQGRGHTGINPMVGAVLVQKGRIIAEAWHEEFGGLHAEANLIKKLDQKIPHDAGLYLNLEPCCHTNKKTPPCTDLIIKSGIKRVIIGMLDPNPKVAGKGVLELRKNGIEVIGPFDRAGCEWFNRGFVSLMKKGRPWITLKRAQTPEGKIACDDGSMMKITNAAQDAWAHRSLRATHDAILVGVGTVISDDPQLTCRIENEEWRIENYQPLRIILDPQLRIPVTAKIVNGKLAKETMVVTKDSEDSDLSKGLRAGNSEEKMLQLMKRGVRITRIPVDQRSSFDLKQFFRVITTPAGDFHGITSILVEGGQKTWEAFWKGNAVDAAVTLLGREQG